MEMKLAIEIPVGSVGGRVRKCLFAGRKAVEIQIRGNDLGVPSLVMRGRDIWHQEKGVGEPVLDVGVMSCSSWCKTFPLSCAFSFEATKVLGKLRVDEARNQSRTLLVKGQVHSLGLERFFAGVSAPRDSWLKADSVVLVCLSFHR